MFCVRVIGCANTDIVAYNEFNIDAAVAEVASRVEQEGYRAIDKPYHRASNLHDLAEQCFWMNWRFSCTYEQP